MSDRISEPVVFSPFGKNYLNKFDKFFLNRKRYNPTLSIMDYFADSFELLFGFRIKSSARKTFVNIPQKWQDWATSEIENFKKTLALGK